MEVRGYALAVCTRDDVLGNALLVGAFYRGLLFTYFHPLRSEMLRYVSRIYTAVGGMIVRLIPAVFIHKDLPLRSGLVHGVLSLVPLSSSGSRCGGVVTARHTNRIFAWLD